MAVIALLHSGHNVLVDTEGEGDSEDCQGEVSQHAEEGEEGQREKHQQHGAEHHARLAHITPVDQVQH